MLSCQPGIGIQPDFLPDIEIIRMWHNPDAEVFKWEWHWVKGGKN